MKDMDFVYDLEDFDGTVIETPPRGPTGIGGWLIIPALLLPCMWALNFTVGFADALSEMGSLTSEVMQVEIGILLFALALPSGLVTLALRHSKHWPKAFIGLMVVLVFGDMLAAADAELAGQTLGRSLFGVILWTVYVLRSKRVRNTFVN